MASHIRLLDETNAERIPAGNVIAGPCTESTICRSRPYEWDCRRKDKEPLKGSHLT